MSSFPRYRYETVRIDKSAKAQLRNDLRLYFGIHTGSIYPEEFNLVHEMIRKSKNVSSGSFSLENELKLIFHNIEKLSEYYLDELEVASKDEYQQIIKTAEAELFDYHLRLKSFLDHLECHGKRCGFSKRYFLVLVACRHLTCTKTECRKMFLSLIAPLTTIRLNRGKRSNRLPYIFAQGQER